MTEELEALVALEWLFSDAAATARRSGTDRPPGSALRRSRATVDAARTCTAPALADLPGPSPGVEPDRDVLTSLTAPVEALAV